MKNKPIIGLMMILSLITTGLYANSVFSFHGFPVQDYNLDVYGLGMGETGLSDTFRRNKSFLNPSLSTTLNQVYFSTGISAGYYYYLQENGEYRGDGLNFPYFNLSIPLSQHRIGFNYASYLSGNADVYVEGKPDDGFEYTSVNKIRSFIYKGSFFYAYKNRFANVGLSFNYLFGHRTELLKQEYKKAGHFENPVYELEQRLNNYGFSAGVNKTIGNLAVGGFYSTPISLTGEKELLTVVDTVFSMGDSKFETPHHFGLGFTWRINDIFKIASDLNYELWSKTNQDIEAYKNAQDTYKIAAGFAYEPIWGHEKWYQKIPIRIGGYYRTLPFEVNEHYLEEKAATMGFTIPLQAPNSQLDLSIKYLLRGNLQDTGFEDKDIIFSVELSGFDFFRSRQKKIADREIPKAEYDTFRY